MNWKDIKTLYLRELRSALRERAIVINSIIIPIVLYPLIIWLTYTGVTYISGQTASLKSRVMLQNLPASHRPLRRSLEMENTIELLNVEEPERAVRDGRLDLLVEFVRVEDAPSIDEGNIGARVTYDASRDESATARTRVKAVVDRYRDTFIEREAEKYGVGRSELQAFRVEEKNVSSELEMGRFILGLLLPILLVVMLGMGAVFPAIDTTAGERENGTWETLMSAATSRINILVAKYLYVATMSFVAGVLNVSAMIYTIRSTMISLGPAGAGPTFGVPLESIPVLVAGGALLALFIAAGMMILSAFARTFKEGQSLVSPFLIAFLLPVTFIQEPAQEFTTGIALLPIVNVAMMFRQAIVGFYDWKLIGVTLAVELVCIAAALRLAYAILRHEDFVMGNYHGTLSRFVRQRLFRRNSPDRSTIAR